MKFQGKNELTCLFLSGFGIKKRDKCGGKRVKIAFYVKSHPVTS